MKIFAFIMGLLVLTLSAMPCMDSSYDKGCKAKVTVSTDGSHQEHNDSDDCSPFCSCSCCAAAAIYQAASLLHFPRQVFHTKNYPVYKPGFYSGVSFSIWQPPKIS